MVNVVKDYMRDIDRIDNTLRKQMKFLSELTNRFNRFEKEVKIFLDEKNEALESVIIMTKKVANLLEEAKLHAH